MPRNDRDSVVAIECLFDDIDQLNNIRGYIDLSESRPGPLLFFLNGWH